MWREAVVQCCNVNRINFDGYSGTTAENEPVKVCEIWTSFSGTIEKEDLLFEDQILV
jgi:hypothetical protein